jgi:hypothetical protein
MKPILSIEQARDILHADGADNDTVIGPLVDAIPDYLAVTTGYRYNGPPPPLVVTVAGFLLQLWYNADGTDVEKLQRTINNLLGALSVQCTVWYGGR